MLSKTIVSGPFIRRVEPNGINLSVVFTTKLDLSVCFFIGCNALDINVSTECISLSKNLHQYFFRCSSEHRFPQKALIHYDIVDVNGESVLDEGDYSFEKNEYRPSLVIGGIQRPMAGSCRSPKSMSMDMLVKMGEDFHQNFYDFDSRTDALFLMGDQIYADNVSDEWIQVCAQLSTKYFGADYTECFPALESDKALVIAAAQPKGPVSASRWRTKEMNHWDRAWLCNQAGFTTMFARNHLLLFSEYVISYLLTWSPELWKEVEPTSEVLKDFVKGLPLVQKLMANVPVYMIFDDHDMTDDWNINNFWETQIEPLGKQVLCNGLVAYYLFQGWGNDPDNFSHGKGLEFKELLNTYLKHLNSKGRFDLKLAHQIINKKLNWSYQICFDDSAFVVMDTRTNRHLGSQYGELSGLMTPQAIDLAFKDIPKFLKQLCVISASPVFGFTKIESFQNFLGFFRASVTMVDRETWRGDAKELGPVESYQYLQEKLQDLNATRTVILSGDVHYGFVKYGSIGFENGLPNVWQICASALRNQPPLTRLTRWYLNWTNYWYKPSRINLGRPRLIASSEKRIVFDYPNYAILDLQKQEELLTVKHGKRKIETHEFSSEDI